MKHQIRINLSFFELLTLILVFGKLSDNLAWPWVAVWGWAVLLGFLKGIQRDIQREINK